MGDTAVLDLSGRYFSSLEAAAYVEHQDVHWLEDAILQRTLHHVHINADAICDVLVT